MSAKRLSRAALLLGLGAGLLASGCGPAVTPPSPTATAIPDAGEAAYALCPVGDLPPDDVNAAAISIVERRLRALGIEDGAVSIGRCLDITVPGRGEDEALRAALFGTGLVEILAVPAGLEDGVQPGLAPPDELVKVLDTSAVAGASPVGGGVDVTLTEAGVSILGTWTTTHAGESLAVVLDGVVIGLVPIDGPMPGGTLAVPVDGAAGIDPQVAAALLDSGPLPGDWRQPDLPQG